MALVLSGSDLRLGIVILLTIRDLVKQATPLVSTSRCAILEDLARLILAVGTRFDRRLDSLKVVRSWALGP